MGTKNAGGEVCFDLDASAFSNDEFRMFQFKVKRCPRARPHDWTQCPFAHPGEKAKRRDPRRYRYSGTACPEFRRNGCCRRGDACPFAHGVFECWLHPSRYRTQMCTDGISCKRRVCFFAHTDSELRKPEEDPVWLQQQLQAELAADQQAQQQLQALKVFSHLLGVQGQNGQNTAANMNLANKEALKNLPIAALLGLTGSGTQQQQPQQQQQQQQQQTMEDKLKLLVQHMAGGSSQTSSGNTNILQLIQLLEKQQQSTTPDVQQQPTPQAMQQQQLASLASSLLGGGAPGLETSSSNEVQLKLAQQLLQQQQPQPQQDPLQARLAQLQKLNVADQMKGHANQQALDILALLTAQQPQDPLAMRGSGAPASTNLSAAAALQQLQLAAQAGLDIGAPAHHSTVAPQPSASDAMALLAAALNNNVGTAAPEATSHSTGSSAGGSSMLSEPMNSFPVDQAVLDQNSLAALLQQSGLMQQSSLPAAAPTVSNVQPQQLSNLQSLLTSLSLGSTSSGGGAASEASAESAPVPAPAQDKRPPSTGVTEQVEPASASTSRKSTTDDITLGSDATVAVQAPTMSTKQLLQQPANFPAAALAALAASGGDKALMGLCADLSGGKQDMFRNAKVLLESLSLLQGGSIDTSGAGGDVSTSIPGSAMTGGGPSVEEVSAAMNRNNSFDKILSELPRSLSDIAGTHESASATSNISHVPDVAIA
eukprot:CAMPEP_0202895456 /NCGR_PEP_ID=MMETSP1392-20130828/4652_1 /ASSEMBLY_ACC=CAM_ASM_000868 /TAXON_ID=225041 /ORGANISM="Chlamydomonas chlamydogama, Strain SAG 11-48b" /LENGTH=709 /DNA_ID=CAMNT_0049580473 /DNA_START=66 /DNA_END=2195 /DNA_ORIENTATION=+